LKMPKKTWGALNDWQSDNPLYGGALPATIVALNDSVNLNLPVSVETGGANLAQVAISGLPSLPSSGSGTQLSTFATTGFTTPYWSATSPSAAAQSFADLKATGANSVIIDFTITQASLTSNTVSFGNGATLQNLASLIGLAKQAGLDVWVKPLLDVVDAHLQWWKIAPADPNAWFQSYDQMLVNIAQTSQQAGASHFLMANELNSMTVSAFNSQWTTAINEVRSVFSGQIGFNTPGPGENSGDIAHNPAFNFPLYNSVDFVGLDMYPDFTTAGSFSTSEVQSGWTSDAFGQNLTQALNGFFSQVNKPVYFTEFGNPAISGGNQAYYQVGATGGSPDPQGQAIFYNASLNYILSNFSSHVKGVFIYDWDLDETHGQSFTSNPVDFDWDVFGKAAQQVITDIYGGNQYIGPFVASFPGSVGSDQIYLYGNHAGATSGVAVTQAQTFVTTVSVTIGGTIINGQAPTVHFYINSVDEGTRGLSNIPGTFVDPKGVQWDAPQTFTVTLNGLENLSQLQVSIDSAVNVGGVENSQTFISAVMIDGVSLTQGTYHPLQGAPQTLPLTSGGQYDGGYELIDATPWNTQLLSRNIGTAGNPIQVNGGGGSDTVYVLGLPSEYTISGIGTSTIGLSENIGLNQNATLAGVAYVTFQDGSVLNVANGTWSANSQSVIGVPAVAVEASMYGNVGSSAEIAKLITQYLPAQAANAIQFGYNAEVYDCEGLGLVFAFGDENGGMKFANSFGPSNSGMPNSAAGDGAFAAAAASAIFGSSATANTPGAIAGFVANWKAFFTAHDVVGVPNATADQIDLAARGAAWGDAVGIALTNNLGSLSGQVNNFLNDVAFGIAVYSAPLPSQPTPPHLAGSSVQLSGLAESVDHVIM
jgi:hypothetical protein